MLPWNVTPDIPSTLSGNTTIESATFRISSLRVIGDADPGDPRTTQASFVVQWGSELEPQAIVFNTAPSGLSLLVRVDRDRRRAHR